MKYFPAFLLVASAAQAQDIRTTIVALDDSVADNLAVAYNTVPGKEQMWCVDRYTTEERQEFTLIRVNAVSLVDAQTTKSTVNVPTLVCRDPKDKTVALPTIHSHPNHSCQASPHDVEVILARMAKFDGILCGDRYITWQFSSDYIARLRVASQPN